MKLAAAQAVVSQETRGGLMAEVTGGTPLSRGSMVRAVRTKGASIAGIRLAAESLCGGRSLVRSVPGSPGGTHSLEIRVVRGSG